MIAFAYYLLKMFVCSGLLFGYYHLALKNKLFHQWNRFYLLAAIIISLVVPLLQFDVWSANDNSADIKLLKMVYSADEYVATVTASRAQISLDQWISIGYGAASVFVFAIFVLALIRIYSIIKSHSVVSIDDIKFVNTEERSAPFSFLNYVVWNKQIDLNTTSGEHIFQHELVHVREKHSFDTMFLQLVLIAFWCNPFFWLIKKELRMIHEFIADKRSVGQSDAHAFATMILQTVYPQHYTHLTNQFFHQSIKRRLAMLTKNNNPKLSYLSRVLALPLMGLLIMAFTIKQKNKATENTQATLQSSGIIDTASFKKTFAKTDKDYLEADIKPTAKNDSRDTLGLPDPIIIIDGNYYGKNKDLNLDQLITPDKIHSLNVLKGGNAIAKYGEKGKDGVIEITTKKEVIAESLLEKINTEKKKPLVIIDGKESAEELDNTLANYIQTISVLKGETATSIYGPKAANGAIIITTKDGTGSNINEVFVDGVKIRPVENNLSEKEKNAPIEIRGYGQPRMNNQTGARDTLPNKIFIKTEEEAKFPGGSPAWRRFLERNLNAQVPSDKGAPTGSYTVELEFIVNLDGSLWDVKAMTKHGYGMEEEAVRALKNGPEWIPAQQNGKAVASYRKQTITFVIADQ